MLQRNFLVRLGKNNFFDGNLMYKETDDHLAFDAGLNEQVMVAGPDGICQTFAKNEPTEPVDFGKDLEALERSLNKIYNPYFVEWKVDKVAHKKAINFDLNKNGYFDPDFYTEVDGKLTVTKLGEEDLIINQGRIGNSSHFLFFINGILEIPGTVDSTGRAVPAAITPLARETGFGSAIIFTENLQWNARGTKNNEIDVLHQVCAHELGHAAFKLEHTLSEDDPNLLTPYGYGTTLRKFQWHIIHGNTDSKK